MEAKNYKIYIDEAGVIKAILLPEKPNPEYYNTKSVGWSDAIKIHNSQVSKAKQEAVPFNYMNDVIDILNEVSTPVLRGSDGHIKTDTIHDFPEGYSVEVEKEWYDESLNAWVASEDDDCVQFRHVATLKKTSTK